MSTAKEFMKIPVDPIPLKIITEKGTIFYKVELAFSKAQSKAGLMYRTDFPHDHAMLFRNVISDKPENEREMLMWMADTPLPLDMMFVDSRGIIVSIVENARPFSEDIISSKVPAAFAIEINAGEVADKRIQKGQRIIHPAIYEKY
ncbi:DUF192 domain-containing protein [Bartonella australis]|nr:DUF192 domain-containing protein [Bartonella australis]